MKKEVKWQYLTAQETISAFETDAASGLSEDAVAHRKKRFGDNTVWQTKPFSKRAFAVRYILDAPVLFLCAAFLVAAFSGFTPEFAVICFITVAYIAFRANCELLYRRALQRNCVLGIPDVRLLRSGKLRVFDATEVVPGDVVFLREGDIVPADLRVISASGLVVSEKNVTANKIPVEKISDALPRGRAHENEDLANILFAGSYVLKGSARAVAVACGDHTLAAGKGSVVSVLPGADTDEYKKSEKTAAIVSAVLLGVSILFIFAGLVLFHGRHTVPELVMSALAFAVSSCGTVWSTSVIFSYARFVGLLSDSDALVRDPSAKQKADSADVLLIKDVSVLRSGVAHTDSVYLGGKLYPSSSFAGSKNVLDTYFRYLCISAGILPGQLSSASSVALDNRTDPAVVDYCETTECAPKDLVGRVTMAGFAPRSAENPLDTALCLDNGDFTAVVSGDISTVLSVCKTTLEDGYEELLSELKKKQIAASAASFVAKGMRIAAVAKRSSPVQTLERLSVIQNSMTFVGFAAVDDPLSEGTEEFFSILKNASVTPVIFSTSAPDCALVSSLDYLGAKTVRVASASDVKRITPEKGIPLVCDLPAGLSAEEYGNLRGLVARRLKRAGLSVACAAFGLDDGPALADSDLHILVRRFRRSETTPYSVAQSADVLCQSESGKIVCPSVAEVFRENGSSDRLGKVRTYLLFSQLLRFVTLVVSLFIDPMIASYVYLIWAMIVDQTVSAVIICRGKH